MLREIAGNASGGLIVKTLKANVDGKNPAKDTAVGAGIVTGGLAGAALIMGAPVTVPLLALGAFMGGVFGFCGGQNKKNEGS
ncbi:hypothetical protein KKH15_02315 [Patescibacteria group bacterium]|nr:hypothetical protein [Patescibacteria group bacterium]MBU1754809.1 hypothetical protein [Patescibacteria group bacterium]